jgi:uncharacterized membrane protein
MVYRELPNYGVLLHLSIFIFDMNSRNIRILMEVICLCVLLATLAVAAIWFERLPDRIPHHFSFSGHPTEYGGKKMIWSLPVFSGILHGVLTLIAFFIRTVAAAESVPKAVLSKITGMLLQLKLLFSLVFFYLVVTTVRIGLGKVAGLGRYHTFIYLLLFGIVLIYNIVAIFRAQKLKA